METFVFEGTEVKKTGRIAVKKLAVRNKELILVEVTPVDSTFDWKKWVRPEDLYEVKKWNVSGVMGPIKNVAVA